MKIEVRRTEFISPYLADDEYYEIYITRKQFMSEYEDDKEECLRTMQQIAEMYTSPHCFESSLSKDEIDGIYQYLAEHKSTKGIVFQIVEKDSYSQGLKIYIVK